MNKYWIIGPPGSGKSTLSKFISKKKDIEWYELDSIYWKKGWQRRDDKEFVNLVHNITNKDSWILDGYYESLIDVVDYDCMIILINKSLTTLLFRVLKRSIYRIIYKEKVCGDNYENLRFLFVSDGLIKYTISQYMFFKNNTSRLEKYTNIFKVKSIKEISRYI